MQVEFDVSEVARLAKNRKVNMESLVADYINEYITLNPVFLYDLQFLLEDREEIFRCINCGYWLELEEMSPYTGSMCRECDEEHHA